MLMPGAGMGAVVLDHILVPDSCVGLVEGRRGEQLRQIQQSSGCRVQMAGESNGHGQRQCALEGKQSSVATAREMIMEVINRAGGGERATHEILIPGAKCGRILGYKAATIKAIQEQAEVKMLLIEGINQAPGAPQPLRIWGDPQKVEVAREMVEEILKEVEIDSFMPVPPNKMGLLMGRNGFKIEEIRKKSGAGIWNVQPNPVFLIKGNEHQVRNARFLISEVAESVELSIRVPVNKVALVIGEGGKTIKQICRWSRAVIYHNDKITLNASEKVFIIKGTPFQIHHAQHMIRVYTGDIPKGTPVPPFGIQGGTEDWSQFHELAVHFKGADQAVLRNVNSIVELSNKMRTAYGPNGMNTMVINNMKKLLVTNDAATILNELEIQHHAVRLLVLAAQMQEKQIGDYTNSVILFAAELLEHAAECLHLGLKPVEVANAYDLALKHVEKLLPEMVVAEATELQNIESVKEYLKSSIASKQFDYQQMITDLVANACVQTVPMNSANFSVDNIRICKILGSGVQSSRVMNGVVFKRGTEGSIKKVDNARIAVFTCPFDITQTETKGTLLMNTAEDLKSFTGTEESKVESHIKGLADAGVNCVVAGGKFGDIYLHFLNKFNIMAVRLKSKSDLRHLCRSILAEPQASICIPSVDQLGHCDHVFLEEIGNTNCTVFHNNGDHGSIATIIVRGSSQSRMDDVERAINDAVRTYRALTKDNKLLAGAGAIDMQLSERVQQLANITSTIAQSGIRRYGLALSILPKQLAKNNGHAPNSVAAKLISHHSNGENNFGVDIITGEPLDAVEAKIFDVYDGKLSAIRLASKAVSSILRFDQNGDDDGMV